MPAGWTPKSTAPVAFDLAQATGALITGEPDAWLSDYLHLLGGEVFSTANLCTNVDLNPPGLEWSDFTSMIPTGALTGVGFGIAASATMFQLKDKLAAYAAARIGRAYCEFTAPVAAPGAAPANGGAAWVLHVPAGIMRVDLTQVGYYVAGVLQPWPTPGIQVSYDAASIAIGDNITLGRAYLNWSDFQTTLLVGYEAWAPGPTTWWIAVGKPGGGGLPANAEIRFTYVLVPYPRADVEPPDHVTPHTPTFTDVPSLAPEMANLERKLELVRDLVQYLVGAVAPPAVFIGEPIAAADPITGLPVALELPGAKGIVVTVSGIPPQTEIKEGTPQKYRHLGRVTFGTSDAWFRSIEITENPLVIAPIPPFVVRTMVHVTSPATATIRRVS